jgi:hypothetical protein
MKTVVLVVMVALLVFAGFLACANFKRDDTGATEGYSLEIMGHFIFL